MKVNHLIRTTRSPDALDAHVGARLRERRTLMGLSQQSLGARVEITFQQLQKYEAGVNRVSAGRLYRLAQVLDVNMSYFFEGADSKGSEAENDSMPLSRETLELVRAYHAIADPEVRSRVYDFVKSLGGG